MGQGAKSVARQSGKTRVLLLALLIALFSCLSAAHLHATEQAHNPLLQEQVDQCVLCHAAGAATLETAQSTNWITRAHRETDATPVSSVRLGYLILPESRPPPQIS